MKLEINFKISCCYLHRFYETTYCTVAFNIIQQLFSNNLSIFYFFL